MVDDKKRENAEGSLPSILGDPGAVSRVRRKVGSNVRRGCLPSFPLPIVPLPFFPSTQPPCDTLLSVPLLL